MALVAALAAAAGCPIEGAPDGGGDDDAGNAGVDAGTPGADGGFVVDSGAPRVDAGFVTPPDAGFFDAGPLPPEIVLRVVAANLTSGNLQSWLDPGRRILKGVKPDIALLQELNVGNGTGTALRAFVDDVFGAGYFVHRETTDGIPNGIVSKWPIVESGAWDDGESTNREFAYARIDLPGPRDLWAVSVHLLTESAATRDDEANELVDYITEFVPDLDYVVVGGDLNTDNTGEPALATFATVLSTDRVPVDQDGVSGTNASRGKPYDHVLPDPDLEALSIAVEIGASSFPDGLVVDTRVYEPLSDLSPALVGDSDADSMQHMAVVRDFLVPTS